MISYTMPAVGVLNHMQRSPSTPQSTSLPLPVRARVLFFFTEFNIVLLPDHAAHRAGNRFLAYSDQNEHAAT